jgi:hypothetical protein
MEERITTIPITMMITLTTFASSRKNEDKLLIKINLKSHK